MSPISPPDLSAVPEELKSTRSWVRWKFVPDEGKKPRKVPITPSGPNAAKVDGPSTWGPFDEALSHVGDNGTVGVGLVFNDQSEYGGFDIDGCIDPETGLLSDDARAILEKFNTYAEISPSGLGVKGIFKGKIPSGFLDRPDRTGFKVDGFEIYHSRRFFTITGRHVEGTPTQVNEANGAIPWFIQTYIQPRAKDRQDVAAPPSTRSYSHEVPIAERFRRAKAWLKKVPPAIDGQGGSNHTFVTALHIVQGFLIPPAIALEVMEDWNATCQGPWSKKDLLHKLTDAEKSSLNMWGEKLNRQRTDNEGLREVPKSSQEFPSEVPGSSREVPTTPLWLTPAQAILRAKDVSHRFKTGIPAIDDITGGGIPPERVLLLAGAPGSGKTTLGIQIACNMSSAGAAVSLLLADEGLNAGVIRIAQRIGFDRTKLEAADQDTIRGAANKLAKADNLLFCMDPDHPEATMENFFAGALKHASDRPQVWLIDSAQTVFPDSKSEVRVRIKNIAERIKSEARKRAAVVIFLSQTNRAAYRSKKEDDNSNPLSAAAESGAIEHMADALLFLTANDNLTKVIVPKNRLGKGPSKIPFFLLLNRTTATFSEVDHTVDESGEVADKADKIRRDIDALSEKIVKVIRRNPEGMSSNDIDNEIPGRRAMKLQALDLLRERGAIFSEPCEPPRRGRVWKAGTTSKTP